MKNKERNTDFNLEYQKKEYHNVTNEESSEGRNGSVEKETGIHIDVNYKNKEVRVHLEFSEEQDDKNARAFYEGLKKIYMEKLNLGLLNQVGQR